MSVKGDNRRRQRIIERNAARMRQIVEWNVPPKEANPKNPWAPLKGRHREHYFHLWNEIGRMQEQIRRSVEPWEVRAWDWWNSPQPTWKWRWKVDKARGIPVPGDPDFYFPDLDVKRP